MPGVPKSISRYARRLSAVDSIAWGAKRFVIVRTVSSAARMPFPSATIARAVSDGLFMVASSLLAPAG
jgi:hypothetical protein